MRHTDVITPNMNDSVESLVEKEQALRRYYTPPKVEHLLDNPKPLVLPRDTTPWHKQFQVLLRRSLKETWRKRGAAYVLLAQTVVIAVLIGTVFLRIGTSQSSVTRRQPVLFFTVINQVGGKGRSRQREYYSFALVWTYSAGVSRTGCTSPH